MSTQWSLVRVVLIALVAIQTVALSHLVDGCRAYAADPITAQLKENRGVGIGFDLLPDAAATGTVKLTPPQDWYIVTDDDCQTSSKRVDKSGTTFWERTSATESEHVWKGYGFSTGLEDKHNARNFVYSRTHVRFEGLLFQKEPGEGDPPPFSASVADLDLAFPNVHDVGEASAEEPYGGLGTRVILDADIFPDEWPLGEAKHVVDVTLRLSWKGPPESPSSFGTLTLGPVGGDASGVKLYENEQVSAFSGSVTITPDKLTNGVFARTYRVVTNRKLTHSAIIQGVFQWDSSLAGSTQDDTAKDNVRLMLYWIDLLTDSDNSVVLERDYDERVMSDGAPGKYLTYVEGASRVEVDVQRWPATLAGVTGKLWSPNDGAGLQVWMSDTGGEWAKVELGTTWDLSHSGSGPPSPLWVTATQAGQSELRFSLYDAANTELNNRTLVFTGLNGAVSNTGWDYWTEVKAVGLFGQPKVGGVPLTAEELADGTVPHWRELPSAERGTPIPPDQQPENRFTSGGNSFRTLATNYADGKQGTAVVVGVWWRIADGHSGYPAHAVHDSLSYYGNSGVFLFNQYEVQIIDANNYSDPEGGPIVGVNLSIPEHLKTDQEWRAKFQDTIDKYPDTWADILVRYGTGKTRPILVSESIPGALYGQLPLDETRRSNYSKAQGEWNKLSIRFWPKTADGKLAYMQTWVNNTLVMDQEVPEVTHERDLPWNSGGVYLQSHWGSNVEFHSPVVQDTDHPRPN